MGECKVCANADNEYCFACDNGNQFKSMTNADHIRAMTDDVELAKYLCKLIREGVMMAIPGAHYSNADIEELNQDWLDWLKQEVDDG